LAEDFKNHEEKIGVWLLRIFGFKLPGKIDLVLDCTHGRNSNGSCLSPNPSIVSLQIESYNNGYPGVLLHELLHSLIGKDGSIIGAAKNFEEALLDYFAPQGVLDEKVGLIKTLDIDEHQKSQERGRPYSIEESRRLLPVIKEYYKICGEKTIWRFLEEKRFTEIRSLRPRFHP
jgi:hypothetical protein